MSLRRTRWPGSKSSVLVSVVAASLAAFTALHGLGASPSHDGTIAVEVTPVPLDPAEPSRSAIGPLRYLGGLWLRAADPRFGGFSDVRVSANGDALAAVSDCGSGLTARLSYDDSGHLVGLDDARLVSLTSPGGAPLRGDDVDAESLVALPGGDLEVGFEGHSRVQVYGPGFAGPARPVPAPPGLVECGRNGGLELMADAGEGRRLLVCETRRGPSSSVPAWVGEGDTWQQRTYPLSFAGGWAQEPFRPTGAARLPGGDLLIVERSFPPLAVRLARLERAMLAGAGTLQTRELARLEPPLTLDNFEGVDVRQDERGRTLVYLLSDDNNCAKPGVTLAGVQRTLLLLFELSS